MKVRRRWSWSRWSPCTPCKAGSHACPRSHSSRHARRRRYRRARQASTDTGHGRRRAVAPHARPCARRAGRTARGKCHCHCPAPVPVPLSPSLSSAFKSAERKRSQPETGAASTHGCGRPCLEQTRGDGLRRAPSQPHGCWRWRVPEPGDELGHTGACPYYSWRCGLACGGLSVAYLWPLVASELGGEGGTGGSMAARCHTENVLLHGPPPPDGALDGHQRSVVKQARTVKAERERERLRVHV